MSTSSAEGRCSAGPCGGAGRCGMLHACGDAKLSPALRATSLGCMGHCVGRGAALGGTSGRTMAVGAGCAGSSRATSNTCTGGCWGDRG